MNYTGGLLWMKKVADHFENDDCYVVLKSYTYGDTKKLVFKVLNSIRDFTRIVFRPLDIAIMDSWGESNLVLWFILKTLKKNVKTFVVFHHYEDRIPSPKNIIESFYNTMIRKVTSEMLKNCDIVLTVSQSSMDELKYFYFAEKGDSSLSGVKGVDKYISKSRDNSKNKIIIVGTGIDIDILTNLVRSNTNFNTKKDIDFLCIGRIEKFFLIEEIWLKIKKLKPYSNLVIIGRSSPELIYKLVSIGIDHRGFVSEAEKIDLYARAKVFIFPSSKEGFGIAVAEAIFLGIPVIAWKIPVFKELYSKNKISKIKLIEYGDSNSFADKCIIALNEFHSSQSDKYIMQNFTFPTWNIVAQNVMSIIKYAKY